MEHNNYNYNVYIASAVADGGIYRYHAGDDGALELIEKTPIDRPYYMDLNGDSMYVVMRAPIEGSSFSGVTRYHVSPEGSLTRYGVVESTLGGAGAHIVSSKRGADGAEPDIYCSNYLGGSVIKLGSRIVVHEGHGPNPKRQEAPHPHQTIFAPDGRLCTVDLGLDTIFVYDTDLNLVSKATVPAGHGPRHIIFSPCGRFAYVINEVENTITSFEYSDGVLTRLDTVSTVPADFTGHSQAAAIRFSPDGRFLYASNRGHNSIAVYAVDGPKLELVEIVSCEGNWPRDFNITPDGKFLYCTNELGNDVTTFIVDQQDGTIKFSGNRYELATPLNVIFG